MKTFIFLLILSCLAVAQVQQQWVARFNGTGNNYDIAYAMTIDGSGNIYVTGTSYSAVGANDIVTIKYNSAGSQVWLHTFNAGNQDKANAIDVDNAGNVYVTGSSNQGLGSDYVTIKYNSAGALQWFQFYEGPVFEEDVAAAIEVDTSGNVYVTGSSTGEFTGFDYATIKYSSTGVELWVNRYNDPANVDDGVSAMVLDASGNIYVSGSSNYNYTTLKYDPSGTLLWNRSYNGPGNSADAVYDMTSDISGNIYITGLSIGTGTNYDYATIKYNSSGAEQWVSRYGNNVNQDYAYVIAVDISGNVFVSGNSNGDFATVKYNPSGVQQWVSTYNGPGGQGDEARSITVDTSGNVYVTGLSYGNSTTTYDFATLCYSPNGVQQWLQRYNGPGNFYDIPFSIAVDGSGNVYVSGQSGGSGSGLDYAVVKYAPIMKLKKDYDNIPERTGLSQNYPNPFNPMTHFGFRIADFGLVNLTIYDNLGREIETLVSEKLQPGTYEAEWDATKYSSGIYYYRLTSSDFSETRKMILIK